jgi:hypothetical protein
MEEAERVLIPTLSRAKVSRKLSYPIGAAQVSISLASVAQLPDLKLHFYSGFDIGLRRGHYEFLRVEYLSHAVPAGDWAIPALYKRPQQYRWEIVVQPVPRTRRHRIHQYILDPALLQVAQWLGERADLAQRGNDILAFFYDEEDEDFTARRLTRLEPLRDERGRRVVDLQGPSES